MVDESFITRVLRRDVVVKPLTDGIYLAIITCAGVELSRREVHNVEDIKRFVLEFEFMDMGGGAT